MSNFDDLKMAVEALTGGKNTVFLDDIGLPSIMVRWDPLKNSALLTNGSDVYHPGSIVNSDPTTMFISKYQNVVVNDRAYSLPMCDPKVEIKYDDAITACRSKGRGWGLMPFSLWAQIALLSKKNGTMPRGNNAYGKDSVYTNEKGIGSSMTGSSVARTATGSGPATWNHNWRPDGIADLNGNVNEWCAGLRIKAGEIQIIPNADCMDPDVSLGSDSNAWKAIKSDGTLVSPGTTGTLKYDYRSSKITLISDTMQDTSSTLREAQFKDLAAASGLTVPELAMALILYPEDTGDVYGGDYLSTTGAAGEHLPYCGGSYNQSARAGVFCSTMTAVRQSLPLTAIGFRSVYCDLTVVDSGSD